MSPPEIAVCRACGSADLTQVLDLGLLAISDFLRPGEPVEHAPMEVLRCAECTLVQLRHTVSRERLYRAYWYRSGTQEAMVSALQDVAAHAQRVVKLKPGDAALDIGANDGTLLRMFPRGVQRWAFEPAHNLTLELSHAGARRMGGFFPEVVQGQVVGTTQRAKLITSIACFYDVDDPNVFVEGIKRWLHPEGVWINQLAYLPDTLRTNNVGDFCHEHLTYWTVEAFERLLERHGLSASAVSFNEVNGGSVRFEVRPYPGPRSPWKLLPEQAGLAEWHLFGHRLEGLRSATRSMLEHLHEQGRLVYGYGASTKGNTLLQYYGIGPELLPAIADRNPDKWGKQTVTGIPIWSEEQVRGRRPDFLFVLPFHFLDAFVQREHEWLARGGAFLVPLPTLRTVGPPARLKAEVVS